jgi:hypothetical protein
MHADTIGDKTDEDQRKLSRDKAEKKKTDPADNICNRGYSNITKAIEEAYNYNGEQSGQFPGGFQERSLHNCKMEIFIEAIGHRRGFYSRDDAQ